MLGSECLEQLLVRRNVELKHDRRPNPRAKPARLTTSTGTQWLIVGGLFSAIAMAVLISLTQLPPPGVALTGAIAVGVLYLAMVATWLLVTKHWLRLLAGEMLLMAAISLGATLIVAANAS